MTIVQDVCDLLDSFAPPHLAEEWDNTGLLVGDAAREVARVMTCLTLTPESVDEAVQRCADLVVSHHPLPFRPIRSLSTASSEGALLWRLAGAGVSVYSPHTAFDSAPTGINAALCVGLGIKDAVPLAPDELDPSLGAGRVGRLASATTLDAFAATVKTFLSAESVRVVGEAERKIAAVAVACGAGGSFIDAAVAADADALVTGEATFHNCLAAQSAGLALILPGHYASERFAVEQLAAWLGESLPKVEVWASQQESDPLRTAN